MHRETDVLHGAYGSEVLRQCFAGDDRLGGRRRWSVGRRSSGRLRLYRIGRRTLHLGRRAFLRAAMRRPLIGAEGYEQRGSLNDLLPEIGDTGEDDPGIENADREHPDEDAQRVPRAADEADATKDRSRQHVQLEPDTHRGRGAPEPRDRHHRNESDQGSVHREEAGDVAVDIDAAQPRGIRIATDRVRAKPDDCSQQNDTRDEEDDPADHDGQRDRSEVRLAQRDEPAGEAEDRETSAEYERHAVQDGSHPQRDDQRTDSQQPYEPAVRVAESRTAAEAGEDRKSGVVRVPGDESRHDPDEGVLASDREIDIARDQEGGHPDRGHADRRHRKQRDEEVVCGEEVRVLDPEPQVERCAEEHQADAARRIPRPLGARPPRLQSRRNAGVGSR